MRIDGNTVHKCIHEALDYSWCDCSDETREELHVTLPRPSEHWCDGCDETEAIYVMHMTDSMSMDNIFFGCQQCCADVMQHWMTDLYDDTEGWEIKKL